MWKVFFNSRRRLLAGMVAVGFAGPAALAQSASPSLRDCETITRGSRDAGTLGERHVARIYVNEFSVKAFVPYKNNVRVPGFSVGRFSLKLSAETQNGQAYLLGLELMGIPEASAETVKKTRFSVTVEGRQIPSYPTPSTLGDFVLFFNTRNVLPPSFERLTQDILVSVYLPGTDTQGEPDYVLAYDKDRIAHNTREGLIALEQLKERERRAQCKALPTPGPCFLTTAAVEMMGLPDDCWELATLRDFRDHWLARQPGGAEQIAQYYARAPGIAAQLAADPQRLARLYWSDILPSALAARLGLKWAARALYVRMMHKVGDLG